ncbi:very-short-patch-repair endonuclease [Mycetocola sp. CAN_C7]|uniref:DUF559 domain-containing protein n=1 Tax=Mycetocola sp. CAN_C7 TaxID=2787724 RepID=UPI0018CA07BC
MPRRVPLPPELVSHAFTSREAIGRGLSRGRLRSDDVTRIVRGVYASADRTIDVIAAAALRLRPGQFYSHVTAARLHGLYLPPRLDRVAEFHVTAVRPAVAPRAGGFVGHHVEPGTVHVVAVTGIPVASAVDTWRELATMLTVPELVEMGDGLVRRVHPIATMDQLADAVARSAGRRGSRALRAAFALVRPGTDSRQETRLRLLIVRAGLPEPLVNVEIRDAIGRFLALGDLVYPGWKVLVEYDGAHHFGSERQGHHDVDRLDLLMADGWRVIRVHREHMGNGAQGRIRAIRQALIRAGWRAR